MKRLSIAVCSFWLGVFLALFVAQKYMDSTAWSRGYSDCLARVVKALAESDGVYLGHLIVNEPNNTFCNLTFFCIDPNLVAAVELDANDCTFIGGYYDFCGMQE